MENLELNMGELYQIKGLLEDALSTAGLDSVTSTEYSLLLSKISNAIDSQNEEYKKENEKNLRKGILVDNDTVNKLGKEMHQKLLENKGYEFLVEGEHFVGHFCSEYTCKTSKGKTKWVYCGWSTLKVNDVDKVYYKKVRGNTFLYVERYRINENGEVEKLEDNERFNIGDSKYIAKYLGINL